MAQLAHTHTPSHVHTRAHTGAILPTPKRPSRGVPKLDWGVPNNKPLPDIEVPLPDIEVPLPDIEAPLPDIEVPLTDNNKYCSAAARY